MIRNLVNHLKKYKLFILGYIPGIFCVFTAGFMILRFPENASLGVHNGLDTVLTVLIPSMFPFMVISGTFVQSGLCRKSEKIFSYVTEKLFSLPASSMTVLIISLLGGYPLGAYSTLELYEKGIISRGEGQKMLLFCVNPSVSFVLGTLGYFILNKKELGIIIFISIALSSVILGVLTRFIEENDKYKDIRKNPVNDLTMTEAFLKSVKNGSSSMLSIGAFVILFSCFNELLYLFNFSDGTTLFFNSILEVTNGCINAAGRVPVPIIAAIAAFGGICTHFQLMSAVMKLKLSPKLFFASRVLHASFSAIIAKLILSFFPVTYETFSFNEKPNSVAPSYSLPVSVCLIILTVLLILGDSFVIKKRSKKGIDRKTVLK